MTLKKKVLEFLQKYPSGRERKNRARAIWYLLGKDDLLSKEEFIKDAFSEIQSINRLILWHQQHNPELRGSDYNDKQKLEEETMLDLGYQPGHNYYNKKLNEQL